MGFSVLVGTILLWSASSSSASEVGCQPTDPTTAPVQVPWHGTNPIGGEVAWYGSESIAVLLPLDGVWPVMDRERNFGNKLWFWSKDWSHEEEPVPALKLEAYELADANLRGQTTPHTHGFGEGWSAMLTGLAFPASGCWRVTAEYRGSEVTFVTLVADATDAWTKAGVGRAEP